MSDQKKKLCDEPTTTQPINTIDERTNVFLNQEQSTGMSFKKDVKIDQRLSGNNQVTPRTRKETVEIACVKCGHDYKISSKLIHVQDGKMRFTCDNCQERR